MSPATRPPVSEHPDTPAIRVWAPVLVGGGMVLGALLDRLYPIPLLPEWAALTLGTIMFVSGAALGRSAQKALRRAGTSNRTDQPTLALVTVGPYARTRNPLYVAGLLVFLGVGFFVNGLAPFLLFLPLVVLLRSWVIGPEEQYLRLKFGTAYEAYERRVGRWL